MEIKVENEESNLQLGGNGYGSSPEYMVYEKYINEDDNDHLDISSAKTIVKNEEDMVCDLPLDDQIKDEGSGDELDDDHINTTHVDEHQDMFHEEDLAKRNNEDRIVSGDETLYLCVEDGCNKRFKTHKGLSSHKRDVHKTRQFKCPDCDWMFKTKGHLNNHRHTHLTVDKEEYFMCPEQGCSRSFKTKKALSHHIHKLREFRCPDCDKPFKTKRLLKKHKQVGTCSDLIMTAEDPFVCPVENCTKSYTTQKALSRHKRNVHVEKEYKCSECECGFKTSSQLNSHMSTHVPAVTDEPFICPEDGCEKCFKTQLLLSFHKRNVHKDRDIKCPDCDQMFKTKAQLKSHSFVHVLQITQRQFKCQEEGCGKRLNTQVSLICHKFYVHKKKDFKCPECPKMFKTRWFLKNHMHSHAPRKSEEQLVCPEDGCEKIFNSEEMLNNHKHSIHKITLSEERLSC